VGGEENGDPVLLAELLHNKPEDRLVAEEDLRPVDEGAGDVQPLEQAAEQVWARSSLLSQRPKNRSASSPLWRIL
jgi:hypothetical protein